MQKKKFWLFVFTPIIVTAVALSVIIPITVIQVKKHKLDKLWRDSPSYVDDGKERVSFHTDLQKAYLDDQIDSINTYARGIEELSRPKPIEFTWESEENEFEVYLSEKKNFSDSLIYNVNEKKISFTNLKIDTRYYYKVICSSKNIKEGTFLTSNEIIRNMYVSGVTNVRDLGGYHVSVGKVLKQGLIYRTATLNSNGAESVNSTITEKGKNTMLNEMKVKTEIDLRMVDNNEVGGLKEGTGVLGESVKYFQCPMNYNLPFFSGEINLNSLRKVFNILGNSDNYPLFFHCAIGTDRTGYIAWLINAVLGVSEGYLWRDYIFSNFGNIGSKRKMSNISGTYVEHLKNQKGNTVQEKATNYLLDNGVAKEEIDTLRSIMIG